MTNEAKTSIFIHAGRDDDWTDTILSYPSFSRCGVGEARPQFPIMLLNTEHDMYSIRRRLLQRQRGTCCPRQTRGTNSTLKRERGCINLNIFFVPTTTYEGGTNSQNLSDIIFVALSRAPLFVRASERERRCHLIFADKATNFLCSSSSSAQLSSLSLSHRDVDDCVLGLLRGRVLVDSAPKVSAVEQVVVAVLSQEPESHSCKLTLLQFRQVGDEHSYETQT